jgi:menaquinone-dependent protoporphyrinogen oxidase
MTRILIVYTSRHGHTARIARRVADTLRAHDRDVLLRDIERTADLDLHDFDVVIAGDSIHMERHDDTLVAWAERHATTLNRMRTGFFSVSLTAVGDPEGARGYADRFEEDTGWLPTRRICVAGALQYREYSFFTRQGRARTLCRCVGRNGLRGWEPWPRARIWRPSRSSTPRLMSPGARSAWRKGRAGSISGCARRAATSAAATTRRSGTPRPTTMEPVTRSSAPPSPARTGAGATWTS